MQKQNQGKYTEKPSKPMWVCKVAGYKIKRKINRANIYTYWR